MSAGITGTYDGEGANVAAVNAIAASPDVAAMGAADASKKGQGRTSGIAIDRRRRLRVSSESARSATTLTAGALSVHARGVYIDGAGNIVGRLVEDTADRTFSNLTAGQWYPFAFASITSATATGLILF